MRVRESRHLIAAMAIAIGTWIFVGIAEALATSVFRMAVITALAWAAWCGPPDGLWRSDGYGYLIELDGAKLRAYELTSISCMLSLSGERKSDSGPEAVFAVDGGVVRFLAGSAPGEARLHFDGAASDVVLHRVEAKPKLCDHEPENTPQSNYAIFWQTFAENYAFV